jgi:hypothetical protein
MDYISINPHLKEFRWGLAELKQHQIYILNPL